MARKIIGPLKVNNIEADSNGNITINGISTDGTIALSQTASKLATPILINGVAFDGSQSVTIVPAEATHATTAAKLSTPITINGVEFDGSQSIIISDSGSGGTIIEVGTLAQSIAVALSY